MGGYVWEGLWALDGGVCGQHVVSECRPLESFRVQHCTREHSLGRPVCSRAWGFRVAPLHPAGAWGVLLMKAPLSWGREMTKWLALLTLFQGWSLGIQLSVWPFYWLGPLRENQLYSQRAGRV